MRMISSCMKHSRSAQRRPWRSFSSTACAVARAAIISALSNCASAARNTSSRPECFSARASTAAVIRAVSKRSSAPERSSATVITLKAKGSIDKEGIACKVETGRALAVAGLHPATGGSGLELCSGDMLLEALVACAGVTLKSVATAVDVPLKTGNVIAEGDLDFRGTLGVDKEAPVGFEEIRLRFEVGTDAPQDKLDLLLKLTERYCVVYQTIRNGPKVSVSMKRV